MHDQSLFPVLINELVRLVRLMGPTEKKKMDALHKAFLLEVSSIGISKRLFNKRCFLLVLCGRNEIIQT